MNDDLKNNIKQGTLLQKIPLDELKRREEEKKKRMAELQQLEKILQSSQ